MRIKFLTSILCIGLALGVNGQYTVKDGSELLNLKKLPLEKAYVDHTGPLLFSGEYLYYAFYCFNAQSNKLTNISRVGYVALVDENHNYVFEHKIKLLKGLGKGDFFVPTTVPSGKYKLLGYTQWMKNAGLSQVFKEDIIIVNPYLADQSALLRNKKDTLAKKEKALSAITVGDSSTIGLSIHKEGYGTREKVTLAINNYKGYLGNGNYTVQVKKKEAVMKVPKLDAQTFATNYFNVAKKIPQKIGDSLFLPEQRGELFYGKVTDASTGMPVEDQSVVISIPGKEFLLKFSRTDQDGNFYSYLRKDYKTPLAIVQIEDESRNYTIEKGTFTKLNTKGLVFSDFALNKDWEEKIKERSIRNQIENQFFTAKPDSVLQGDPIDPFDGGIPETVLLDDYTRFPTFEETMVEVVKFSGYRNGGSGNDYVKVAQDFETYNEDFNNFPAIVLIDGVYIPNHEKIRKLDARIIEKISLIRDQFRLGGKDYQGIVSVETFEGDFMDSYSAKNGISVAFQKPLSTKNYFKQTYAEESTAFSRIPDYRTLLFWEPDLTIDGSSYNFEFFTSDLEGEYEIIFNGFTSYGKPITRTKTFVVGDTVP